MRKMFAGLTVAAFVVALTAPAFATTETVKGQIVDQTCYMKDKANNGARSQDGREDVADCAAACAKKGAAAGAAHDPTARSTSSPAASRPT